MADLSADSVRLLLGLKLKSLRQKRGVALKDVAAAAGVSVSYLSEIEKGKKYPKPAKLIDLARALDVPFDDLVSQSVSEPLEGLKSAIRSPLWREFPFHLFGIEPEDIVGLIADNPTKAGGLLRVLDEVARDYDLRTKHVLFAALRAYQQQRNNYFAEIEEAATTYRLGRGWPTELVLDPETLSGILREEHGYSLDFETLADHPELHVFRSVYQRPGVANGQPRFLVNADLLPQQQAFLFARELGFIQFGLDDRPSTSSWVRVSRFEPVLNNFLASYFAGALLIPEDALLEDVKGLFASEKWRPDGFLDLLTRYRTTPEMLFYRLTEIIPGHLGITDLYFMRFTQREAKMPYHLTKVLNMSRVPMPHGLRRELDYGKRWRTIGGVQALMNRDAEGEGGIHIRAQRSRFVEEGSTFFEISIARPLSLVGGATSVTMGFLVSDDLRSRVAFVDDPAVPTVDVVYDSTGDRHRARVEALAELGIHVE